MENNLLLRRGNICFVNLDPTVGHEQAKKRPCVIISTDLFNNSPAGLIVILPLTTKQRNIPWQIKVNPPEGGLKIASYIICDQIRTISKSRVLSKPLGSLTNQTLKEIEKRVKILLELY